MTRLIGWMFLSALLVVGPVGADSPPPTPTVNLGHVAPRSIHQLLRLPGIEEVAQDHRDGGSGKDPPVDQAIRETANRRTEADNDNELNEVVDGQTEKAIDILRSEPARPTNVIRHLSF